MRMDFDLSGFDELEKQLSKIDFSKQKRILRRAVKEAAAPALTKIKAAISSHGLIDTGLLYDSVKLKTSIPKSTKWADAIAEVGIYKNRSGQASAGNKIDPPVYAYWLEYGTEPHALGKKASKKSGRNQSAGLYHPGFSAKPFIRPSFDSNIENALNIQKRVLSAAIDRGAQCFLN